VNGCLPFHFCCSQNVCCITLLLENNKPQHAWGENSSAICLNLEERSSTKENTPFTYIKSARQRSQGNRLEFYLPKKHAACQWCWRRLHKKYLMNQSLRQARAQHSALLHSATTTSEMSVTSHAMSLSKNSPVCKILSFAQLQDSHEQRIDF